MVLTVQNLVQKSVGLYSKNLLLIIHFLMIAFIIAG